jgi:BON domain
MIPKTARPHEIGVIPGLPVRYVLCCSTAGVTMIAGLIRLVLILIVVAGVAAFFFGYRWGYGHTPAQPPGEVGTIGRDQPVDPSKARDAGAAIGERAATAANAASEAISDGQLTAKIKSKMALDDLVQARAIDVDTQNGNVTLSGRVRTHAERERAMLLARETAGVRNVVDRLVVEAR